MAHRGDLITNGVTGDGWIVLHHHYIPSTPDKFYKVGQSNDLVHYTAGASCTGEGAPGSGV